MVQRVAHQIAHAHADQPALDGLQVPLVIIDDGNHAVLLKAQGRGRGTERTHMPLQGPSPCTALPLQRAFGRGQRLGSARIDLARRTHRAGDGLEGGFHDVMRVLACELAHVQRHARIGGERDEGVAERVEGRLWGSGSPPFYSHARLDVRRLEDQLQPVTDPPLTVLVPVSKRWVYKWRW